MGVCRYHNPTTYGCNKLVEHKKNDAKARLLILDAMRDHIIPHQLGKTTTREMWEALTKIYQSDNHNKKMVLRFKVRATKMSKTNTMATYLTRIMQASDELAAVGETVLDHEMVRMALNSVTEPWKVFIEGIVAQKNLSKWERLWDDFI